MVDLPGGRLHETIPNFHNTPVRIAALEQALREDVRGRAAHVQKEADFILSRAEECGRLLDLHRQGLIPERITHNDTKVNNILIDDVSGEGICVIDLDTVMPGLALYDFGDLVRTCTSPAAEDEIDLDKVFMRFDMFEALLRGYLASASGFLKPAEREELPFAGKLITLEIATRFLTDYLQGDVYFKTHRVGHNLDRCRNQLKLVQSIEDQFDDMHKLLQSLRGRALSHL
jgi:Ser/Thr protein kinase RdoA (MazF antagonist)